MNILLPSTVTQARTAFLLALGALAGFILQPLLWPFWLFNPLSYVFSILGMAAQESTWNADAVGDTTSKYGPSYGALQFNTSVWPDLTGLPLSDATNSFKAGFYSARYIADALRTSWMWWLVIVPVYGHALLRWMWTHGRSASSAESQFSGDADGVTAWGAASAEEHTWPGYRGLLILFALPVYGTFVALRAMLGRVR